MRHLSTTAKVKHSWEFIHDEIGYNLKMPNLNAALGLAQLENLQKYLISKRSLYQKYLKEFGDTKEYKLIENPHNASSNNWLNTLYIKKSSKKLRNKIISNAHKNKIFLRPIWKPLHTLKPYRSFPKMNLKNTFKIYNSCINLPSSPNYFIK